VFLVVVADVVALGSFGLAAYISDQVQPREAAPSPFTMGYLACTQRENAGKQTITGTVEVRAAPKKPWSFDPGDFDLIVGATRTKADGPAPTRPPIAGTGDTRKAAPPRPIARSRMLVTFAAISPNLGSPPFLLQAGQAALVRFEAETPPDVISFLAGHPDDQRCTLSYTQDYPIGAIAALN
jgi:hypothetical protein